MSAECWYRILGPWQIPIPLAEGLHYFNCSVSSIFSLGTIILCVLETKGFVAPPPVAWEFWFVKQKGLGNQAEHFECPPVDCIHFMHTSSIKGVSHPARNLSSEYLVKGKEKELASMFDPGSWSRVLAISDWLVNTWPSRIFLTF